jgi:NitT/TauT family transport system permease protein
MIVASSRFEVPLVFAGVVVTAIMSVAMYTVATPVETRTISWATRGQADPNSTTGV